MSSEPEVERKENPGYWWLSACVAFISEAYHLFSQWSRAVSRSYITSGSLHRGVHRPFLAPVKGKHGTVSLHVGRYQWPFRTHNPSPWDLPLSTISLWDQPIFRALVGEICLATWSSQGSHKWGNYDRLMPQSSFLCLCYENSDLRLTDSIAGWQAVLSPFRLESCHGQITAPGQGVCVCVW